MDQVSKERETVRVFTDSPFLEEGENYFFKSGVKGYANAEYDFGSKFYSISPSDSGNLLITKHDPTRRILSGRFWFDATNSAGEKVEIREGRFDILY